MVVIYRRFTTPYRSNSRRVTTQKSKAFNYTQTEASDLQSARLNFPAYADFLRNRTHTTAAVLRDTIERPHDIQCVRKIDMHLGYGA
jgi:hypothetical protein